MRILNDSHELCLYKIILYQNPYIGIVSIVDQYHKVDGLTWGYNKVFD